MIEYNLKAQLLPTTSESIFPFKKDEASGVGNLDYESCISDKKVVFISPDRPVVVNPLTRVPVEWSKSVGSCCGKLAHIKVEVEKNYYEAGEVANISVSVDNSNVKQPCWLEIRHYT